MTDEIWDNTEKIKIKWIDLTYLNLSKKSKDFFYI